MAVSAQVTSNQPALIPLAGPTGYVINFSGEFGKFDLRSGVFTRIATVTPSAAGGIGGAPGGPVYTVDGVTGHLLRITAEGVVHDKLVVLSRPAFRFHQVRQDIVDTGQVTLALGL